MITAEVKFIKGHTSYSKIYSSRWGCLECGTIYYYKLMEKAPRKCLNCEFDHFTIPSGRNEDMERLEKIKVANLSPEIFELRKKIIKQMEKDPLGFILGVPIIEGKQK